MPEVNLANVVRPLTRTAWRLWLQSNHKTASEAWVRMLKAAHRQPGSFVYTDAVEEALCFGWIDGICKKIDDESICQRFTPRRPKGNWSEINKQRVRMLERQGLMMPQGWSAIPTDVQEEIRRVAADALPALPKDVETALKKAQALDTFRGFPADYQRIRIASVNLRSPTVKAERAERKQRVAALVSRTASGKMYGAQALHLLKRHTDHHHHKEKAVKALTVTVEAPLAPEASTPKARAAKKVAQVKAAHVSDKPTTAGKKTMPRYR
jgi:uncharacterized protein YdeI (YjbR/CyaY-like superfamily)